MDLCSIVLTKDGRVAYMTDSVPDSVEILEECPSDLASERMSYWDRIINYRPERIEPLDHHFYDPVKDRHLYTYTDDLTEVKILDKKNFEPVTD